MATLTVYCGDDVITDTEGGGWVGLMAPPSIGDTLIFKSEHFLVKDRRIKVAVHTLEARDSKHKHAFADEVILIVERK